MSRKVVQGRLGLKEGGYLIGSVCLPSQAQLVSKASNGGTPTDLTLTWLVDWLILHLEGLKVTLAVRSCPDLGQLLVRIN